MFKIYTEINHWDKCKNWERLTQYLQNRCPAERLNDAMLMESGKLLPRRFENDLSFTGCLISADVCIRKSEHHIQYAPICDKNYSLTKRIHGISQTHSRSIRSKWPQSWRAADKRSMPCLARDQGYRRLCWRLSWTDTTFWSKYAVRLVGLWTRQELDKQKPEHKNV